MGSSSESKEQPTRRRSNTPSDKPSAQSSSRESKAANKKALVAVDSKDADKKALVELESKGATKKTLNEIKGISKFIDEDRGEKDRAIVAVVPADNLEELERRLHSSRWKFWKCKSSLLTKPKKTCSIMSTTANTLGATAKGLVRLTSPDQLQDSIDAIQNKTGQHLTLLASRDIEDVIEFHVPQSFRALSVYRCYHEQDREGRLLIGGASTFRGTRLDEWQGKKHSSKHAIYIGDGVSIKVEMTAADNPWSLLQCAQTLSEEDMQEVKRNLSLICEPCRPGEIWWKKIMGPMAAIMGLLTGKGGKTPGSFQATAAGINVEYHLGTAALSIATAGVKSHTLYTAAGPAAMLGFGAAMVAYVVPWDSVFMWLKGVFAKLYQGFLSLWRSVFAWISEKIFGRVPEKPVKAAAPLRRTQSSRR